MVIATLATSFRPEALRSIDSSTFTGSYQAVGTALSHAIRIIRFYNASTVPVTLSWDGSSDHEILPSGTFILLDVSTNDTNLAPCFIHKGTVFYAKGSAGSGLFYISTYYAG